jgi:hypothetical protein
MFCATVPANYSQEKRQRMEMFAKIILQNYNLLLKPFKGPMFLTNG